MTKEETEIREALTNLLNNSLVDAVFEILEFTLLKMKYELRSKVVKASVDHVYTEKVIKWTDVVETITRYTGYSHKHAAPIPCGGK